MATDPARQRIVFCPSCFRRGLEQRLIYDAREKGWYCRKCLFTGSAEEAHRQRMSFLKQEYPEYDQ